jgi:NADP-dependent 3-hydroxy acid dehydrogenase YdfG
MGNHKEVLSWMASAAAVGDRAQGDATESEQDRCAVGVAGARRVWLIADASSDAGVRLARTALARGDAVVAAARDPALLDALLGEDSASLVNIQMDAASPAQVMLAVRTAVARFGRIDILVDAADGDAVDAPYYVAPAASLGALTAMLPIVLPLMREQGAGHIVDFGPAAEYTQAGMAREPQAGCTPASRLLAQEISAACQEYAAGVRIADYRSYCTVA